MGRLNCIARQLLSVLVVMLFTAVSVAVATTMTVVATRPTQAAASGPATPENITDISCGSSLDCIAIAQSAGYPYETNIILAPTDGGGTWSEQTPASGTFSMSSVSCPSNNDCFIVGRAVVTSSGGSTYFDAVFSTTNGGNTWTGSSDTSVFAQIDAEYISCATTLHCVAVSSYNDADGYNEVGVTTDGGATWTVNSLSGGWYFGASGISCSSTSDCVVTGYNEAINGGQAVSLFSTDGGATWTSIVSGAENSSFAGVSCWSALNCVSGQNYDTYYPFGSAVYSTASVNQQGQTVLSWTQGGSPYLGPSAPSQVWFGTPSCPSASKCIGTSAYRQWDAGWLWTNSLVGSTDGGASWAVQEPLGNYSVSSISCPSTSDCYAVGRVEVLTAPNTYTQFAAILVTTDGGNTWTAERPNIVNDQINYAALGDSYSSGEGTGPPYLGAGQDGSVYASNAPSDQCHRSPKAYSVGIATSNGWNLGFYACSGATTNNILTHKQNGEPAQIRDLSGSTNLVTLTIGGNDVGFKNVITTCIGQTVKAKAENTATFGLAGADPNCVDDKNFVNNENTVIANAEQALLTTFRKIRRTVPGASIIVLDYPQLFPTHSAGQGCIQLSPLLTVRDQMQFNAFAQLLDGFEHEAAFDAGVNFVDVQPEFQRHGVCGAGGAYINGITNTNGLSNFSGSFHPNALGQLGYAGALQNYIAMSPQAGGGFPETPQQLPQNPPPGIDPPGDPAPVIPPADLALVGEIPTQTYGNLEVQPLPADFNAACDGQFQAGQVVQLHGSGYRPGVNVLVDLSSPGEGSNFKHQVASLAANATGDINANVRIPLGTPGFTVPGQSEDMAFLDATGTSATSLRTKHIDNAMFGIAKPASHCGTVDPLGFTGFAFPVANPPALNTVISGLPVPVRFTIPGIASPLNEVLAPGSPESAPVSCATLTPTGVSTPTTPSTAGLVGYLRPDDGVYFYPWFTSQSWTGCRELTLTLADGTVHHAYFKFVRLWWLE